MTPLPTPTSRRSRLGLPLAFAFIYLAWGGTYLAVKFAIVGLPVFVATGGRFLLAGLLLLGGIAMFDRAGFRRGTLREWRESAVIGLLLLVFGIGMGNWAQQYIDSSFAAMVFSGLPLWIILIDWIRPHGRAPTRAVAFALIVGFLGVGIILAPLTPHGPSRPVNWSISLLLVLASISWATGAVFSRHIRTRGSSLVSVARQMIVAGIAILSAGAAHGDFARTHLSQVGLAAWLGFAYLVLIGSLGGYPVYLWLWRVCPPSKASTIPYVNLIVAVFLGWFLGHETLTVRQLVGTAIVLTSVALVLRAHLPPTAIPED